MLRVALLSLLLVAGCGLFGGDDDGGGRPRRARRAPVTQPGMPRLAAGELPQGSPRRLPGLDDGPTVDQLPEDTPGLVVFVVLDTVRADHLSACGYDRPTSPALEALVARGATLTCNAYAPGTWTLPSHASYFTGLDVEDHQLMRKGLRLDAEAPTLAEIFAERGYQTVFLSANPVLKPQTGLTRGFHRVQVARHLQGPMRAEGLVRLLRYELAQLDPQRPIFLFLNIFDAHEPYPKVPPGLDWVPPQDALSFFPVDDPANPYVRFLQQRMAPDERAAWLERVRNGYDHGVHLADQSLARVVAVLERHKLGRHGVRLVVTSDHGENLGEHGLLRHDGPPWETTARVPVLYFDTTRKEPLALPEPFAAVHVFNLLTTGSLPAELRAPRSSSIDYGDRDDVRDADAVATWAASGRKVFWKDGSLAVYDLAADPGEQVPLTPTPEEAAAMEAHVARFLAAKTVMGGKTTDEKLERMLEKLGYTD